MLVGHQLNLDMPRPLDEFFEIDFARPKASLSLATRRQERIRKVFRPEDSSHTLPAATCGSLQHHRVTNRLCNPNRLMDVRQPLDRPRHPGHPDRVRCLPSPCLRPENTHSTCRRANKGHSDLCTSICEIRILRKKPIPRMYS